MISRLRRLGLRLAESVPMRTSALAFSMLTVLSVGILAGCAAPTESPDDNGDTLTTSDALQTCTPLTPSQRGYVKWNPGHYILAAGANRSKQADTFLSGYGSIPAVKGMQKEYFWSELEPTMDNYRWADIDEDIRTLAAKNKKLAIVIKYKYRLSADESSVPQYVRALPNADVSGVSVPSFFVQIRNLGHHANMGHPGTRNRFHALLKAISERYDNNPNVASVSFLETATSADVSDAQTSRFIDGYIKMHEFAGCTFKHTPLFQNTNYPRNRLKEFTTNMVDNGIGLGGPDTFWGSLDDPKNGLGYIPNGGGEKGVYRYYPELSNKIPIGQQVHGENMEYSTAENFFASPKRPHNLSPAASVEKVWTFARDKLIPNYMFWQLGGGDPYAIALKARLTSSAGLPLNSTCPAVYGGKCQ